LEKSTKCRPVENFTGSMIVLSLVYLFRKPSTAQRHPVHEGLVLLLQSWEENNADTNSPTTVPDQDVHTHALCGHQLWPPLPEDLVSLRNELSVVICRKDHTAAQTGDHQAT